MQYLPVYFYVLLSQSVRNDGVYRASYPFVHQLVNFVFSMFVAAVGLGPQRTE